MSIKELIREVERSNISEEAKAEIIEILADWAEKEILFEPPETEE
jgi:hypothetical protein